MAEPACTACDISGCSSTSMLLKKIDSMISDNYTLLFILGVLVIIIGLAISYFMTSLISNIKTYLTSKSEVAENDGDNPRYKTDDDVTYYDNPKDDPRYEDPVQYMPTGTYQYVKNLDKEYEEYNKLKTEYISSTYNGRQNDDILDKAVLFKEYDNYDYNTDDIN